MKVLCRRALCIEQAKTGPLYLFTLRADEVFQVAEIARINRSKGDELIGYQRAEVRDHVQDILEYLDGDDVLFPNALILAMNGTVRFRRSRGPANDDGLAKAGVLEIPIAESATFKPAWIVDGQQRARRYADSSAAPRPTRVASSDYRHEHH